jgi:phosphotransacetylase
MDVVIKKLDEMFEVLKTREKKILVASPANDQHTIEAVNQAVEQDLTDGILVGDEKIIMNILKREGIDSSKFRIVHEQDETKALLKAVHLVNKGKGDIIMKGLVSTDKYMRAILNRENGLMNPDEILSHVSVLEPKNYHKLLIVGDVAIIPLPEMKEKIAILNYLIYTAHSLGIENPKVAILAATEQVLPNMPACIDAAILTGMAGRGQIKGAVIEGPMALDVIIDKESAEIKKINSEVAGDADCILFPNIESGNVFYKYHSKLTGGNIAAVVAGARVPAVLSSRGDSVKTKLYSIALAALIAK